MSITDPTDIPSCNQWQKGGVGMYDSVVAGSAVTALGAKVKRWEDQSGNGNHITQGTDANCFVYDPITEALVSEQGVAAFFNAPAGYSVNAQSFSMFLICQLATVRSDFVGSGNISLQFLTQTSGDTCNIHLAGNDGKLSVYDGGFHQSVSIPATSLCSILLVCSAGNFTAYVNGVATTGTAAGATTADLLYLLGTASFPAQMRVKDVALFSTALSSGDASDLHAYALTRGVISPTSYHYLFDGDSITYGYQATLLNGWPQRLSATRQRIEHNLAEASIALSTLVSQAAARVDPLIQAGKTNVLLLFAGTNDLTGGAAATDIYNDTVTYCTARKLAGWDKIIVVGMLPRSGGAWETSRQSLRTSLLADFDTATAATNVKTGATYADAYIDLAADTTIGGAGDNSNPTYYADGTHPTDTGYAIIAAYADAALDVIVPPPAPTITDITVNTSGDTVTFTASAALTAGAGGTAGFAITADGGAVTLTYASGSGITSIVCSTSRRIMASESTSGGAYTQPGDGWQDGDGNKLATFSGLAVTNNSEVTAYDALLAEITAKANKILIGTNIGGVEGTLNPIFPNGVDVWADVGAYGIPGQMYNGLIPSSAILAGYSGGTYDVAAANAAAAAAQFAVDVAEVEAKKAFVVAPASGGPVNVLGVVGTFSGGAIDPQVIRDAMALPLSEGTSVIDGSIDAKVSGANFGGDGDIAVDHNTGGTDNLRFVQNGTGVDEAEIRAYLKEEYDAGDRNVKGQSITDNNGRWVRVMMLNAGVYVIEFDATGYQVASQEVTVGS